MKWFGGCVYLRSWLAMIPFLVGVVLDICTVLSNVIRQN